MEFRQYVFFILECKRSDKELERGDVCRYDDQCPEGDYCQLDATLGHGLRMTCQRMVGIGEICLTDNKCLSGNCEWNWSKFHLTCEEARRK